MNATREHEHLLIRLACLLALGKGETEEHEALCESMLESWNTLDASTREFFRGLSGDLDMLDDTERLEPSQKSSVELEQALGLAWNEQRYSEVLSLLRKVQAPRPPEKIAYVRGKCCSALGFHEAALAFYDHAARLKPSNGNYAYLAFVEALDLGMIDWVITKARKIGEAQDSPPTALFAAAHALLRTDSGEEGRSDALLESIIDILSRALAAEGRLPRANRLPAVLVGGYVELGLCHERLNQTDLARDAYTDALRIDPRSDAALTARGLLLASLDKAQAAIDFTEAVALKTPLVWPYLYLANRALTAREYIRAMDLCQEGLAHAKDPSQRANLLEWLALAKTGLGEPRKVVEDLFEKALDCAPFNPRIRRNKDIALGAEPSESGGPSWQVANDTGDDAARLQFRRQTLAAA